jgi:peptidoglycan/xylan/chitin deacetylase (PgdA/CDA1 family)
MGRGWIIKWSILALTVSLAVSIPAHRAKADIATRLPTDAKVVALTFDGCEAPSKPAYLDKRIVAVLEKEHLPYAIFASGLFALRNRDDLAQLTRSPLVEIENHSYSHPQHMNRLPPDQVAEQVTKTNEIIRDITGRAPKFFRFPAGNYDARTLRQVEGLGMKVVHWRVPSGDPARGLKDQKLAQWVLYSARPGDILIFHINGRAPETADALPIIIKGLRARGFSFVKLEDRL